VARQFKDWPTELAALDTEIIRLCERRVQLAIEILRMLRSELSLGELTHDADRLTLLLFETADSAILDPEIVAALFHLLTNECRRAAEQAVRLKESNGCGVLSENKQIPADTRLLSEP